jgi:hypothetical protein
MKKHLQDRGKVALCGQTFQEKMEIDIVKVTCKNCLKQIERIGMNRIKYDYERGKRKKVR